jgi:hypothetical protein
MRKGFETRDGKIAGNRQLVETYDKSHGHKSAHMKDKESAGEMKGGGGDGEQSIHDVVAEHGHAHTHIHTKDRESGMHHSETHHEDGHVHHADHEDAQAAHEHGMAAMGDDAEHTEMSPDDAHVAEEEGEEEMTHGKTSHVGYMA